MNDKLKNVHHKVDLCVVGGGLAGMCAAISASRHGLKVVLMHDRPVYGGNASSEIRMWVCGAEGENNRETGIIEELALENLYRNPTRRYPMWDCILFELVKNEKNITPILNCACSDIEMNGNSIKKVMGYQTTTQMWHTVEADYFADCSGDSILAPLSGAEFRYGREAQDEFEEDIAPKKSDEKTMGHSCLIQARETDRKNVYIPPSWARKFTKEDLPYRLPDLNNLRENYWYMELGGEQDTIHDTEEIRDELIKVAYGIWDFIKNSGEYDADNWELDFVGFLPGKRESRRYVGDHLLNQNDIRNNVEFDDVVAYGGWTMDDHNPAGINTRELPTIFHPAPSPFSIPYRSLYSVNIENLWFAGRNISTTHTALSATRVMATCAICGQAVGTAAAVAKQHKTTPRGVYKDYIKELQKILMEDDCWLPTKRYEHSPITKNATITSSGQNVQNLLNGFDRSYGDEENFWSGKTGDTILFTFDDEKMINDIRFVFNSDLNRETIGSEPSIQSKMTVCNIRLDSKTVNVPKTLVKNMSVELLDKGGNAFKAYEIKDNHQRLVKLKIDEKAYGVCFTLLETNGNENAEIYSIDIR